MKFILEFSAYKNQNLNLGRGIVLSNFERIKIGRIIGQALSEIYGDNLLTDDNFEMDGFILKPEYLRKARNNRNLLKKLVYDEYGEIKTGIKSKQDLFDFVENNTLELFRPSGKYFEIVYNLLAGASAKGSSLEILGYDLLKNYFKLEEGIDLEITTPSLDEDLAGIDGKFIVNGDDKTVQIKPLFSLEDYKIDNSKYIAFCDGVLKDLVTDYLIVINNKVGYLFTTDEVITKSSYFLIPKKNLLKN